MGFRILNRGEENKYCILYDDEEFGENYKEYKLFEDLRAKPEKMEGRYLFRPFNAFTGVIVPTSMAATEAKWLSQGAKLLFGLLIYYHGNNGQGAFMSQRKLAEDFSKSRRTISRYVRKLKGLNYIKTEQATILNGPVKDFDFIEYCSTDPGNVKIKELQTKRYEFIWNKQLESSLPEDKDSWAPNSRRYQKNTRKPNPGDEYNPHKLFVGPFVPRCILDRYDLNNGEKLCYGYLSHVLGKTGDAFPSMSEIGRHLGVSKAMAANYIKGLEEEGYIHVVRPEGEERRRNRRNRYKFIWREFFGSGLKQGIDGIRLDSKALDYKRWRKHPHRKKQREVKVRV